jgi:hypothetical protein
LRWAGDNLTTHLLSLDSTEVTQKVHKHDTVRKLRLVIETINLSAILGNGSERDNIVEIESQCRVNVVNKHLHILFGALVEGCDSKSGTMAAETLEDSLVVFNCGPAVVRGSDDDMGTA